MRFNLSFEQDFFYGNYNVDAFIFQDIMPPRLNLAADPSETANTTVFNLLDKVY